MNTDITAQGWFALGERVPYDHHAKSILRPGDTGGFTGRRPCVSADRRRRRS